MVSRMSTGLTDQLELAQEIREHADGLSERLE